jgi:predicted dehydrogenase
MADVVILATPPGFRPLHFKYAIENDKHVFMEKPVATDANGVRQVLESAKIAKKKKIKCSSWSSKKVSKQLQLNT